MLMSSLGGADNVNYRESTRSSGLQSPNMTEIEIDYLTLQFTLQFQALSHRTNGSSPICVQNNVFLVVISLLCSTFVPPCLRVA